MTRKEEIVQAANNYKAQFPDGYIKEYVYIDAAEWADRTMIDKVCEFIRINAYKYRQLKFVKNKATFDFRTDRLIEDLRKTIEE